MYKRQIYLCTFLFIKRESSNCFYGVLCFFLSGLYFSSLNIVRQFLAVSIGYLLFSVAESHKRKNFCWLWYGFSILLLSQIHLSALLILFLPFLKNIRFNRKKTVIFLGALCVAIPVVRNVMYLFLRHTRYSYYLSSNIQLMDLDFSGLVYALMLSSLALYYLPQIQKEHNGLLYYNVLLIYDFAMLSSAFIPLVNRIALYFKFPTVIVLLPMILEQARKQKKYLLIVGILLFMLLSTGYLYFVHGLSGIYPYQSIFE